MKLETKSCRISYRKLIVNGRLVHSEDFGPSFYKFEKAHKISTNRIEIFGQTTLECLLPNEYKFIGLNNQSNIFTLSNSGIQPSILGWKLSHVVFRNVS